jgi:hypothetical protein
LSRDDFHALSFQSSSTEEAIFFYDWKAFCEAGARNASDRRSVQGIAEKVKIESIPMDMDFSNYSLEVLLQEPARLEQSISISKNSFDEGMTRYYDFFIKTCENASTITDDLETCTATASQLSSSLAQAIELCRELSLLGQTTIAVNTKVTAAFQHLPQLSGIIEIPQLMKTATVSKLYDGALQLYQSIENFAHQFPSIPIIQSTLESAKLRKQEVAQALLAAFNERLSVGDIARNVSLLRTAGLHSEAELRLAIVNGRRRMLRQKVAQLNRKPPADFAINLTRRFRGALFKIPNIYGTLFQDREDDLILNVAIKHELREYCATMRGVLDEIADAETAKSVMREVLSFVGSMAMLGFNFCPMVDWIFCQSKWGRQ